MIREHTIHKIRWIEEQHNLIVSKFMREVLDILDHVYCGLHHTDYQEQFKKKDFCGTRSVEYVTPSDLSTYDYNELTKLVILAHDKGIRISVRAENHKLIIQFHNRMGKRTNKFSMSQRHPSLKTAIENIRSNYK